MVTRCHTYIVLIVKQANGNSFISLCMQEHLYLHKKDHLSGFRNRKVLFFLPESPPGIDGCSVRMYRAKRKMQVAKHIWISRVHDCGVATVSSLSDLQENNAH